MSLQEQVTRAYKERRSVVPAFVVRAPGRVNLIGEHTDYNDGFVLPMAIDRAIWIALHARDDRLIRVHSLDFDETADFSLEDLRHTDAGWVEYVKGVAWALQEAGFALTGWEGTVAGDIPVGAGLSSSAALELAVARAFAVVSDLRWDPAAMARLGQRAENDWVGVSCGIMDQLVSAAGDAGHALLIDCRSLKTESIPLPRDSAVVVLDTATRRDLVGSAYNERRAQCEAAAQFFDVPALRDVDVATFEARADELDAVTRRRARHVVTENARTLQAADAMRRDDAEAVGRLMNESHASLRDDFEVSSDALNAMVEISSRADGCYGARMTGAGFGGCAVALVHTEIVDAFTQDVVARYSEETGLTPGVYVCNATDGAEVVASE